MPGPGPGKWVIVSETRAPQPVRAEQLAPDRIARAQQPGEPRAAGMLGEVHDEVVMSSAQGAQQTGFGLQLLEGRSALPFAVDRVHARNRRMTLEQGRGLPIHERVDFRRRYG